MAGHQAWSVFASRVVSGNSCDQRRVESAAGVRRGDQQGCAVLRSRPRECCQETGNEGGGPHEPALGPIRLAGPERRRRVIGEDKHRPVLLSRGHDAEHESLHKIPPKMQANREGQFTGQHITGSEQQAEDDDVEHAQPRRVLIRRMRQAKEDGWNHDSDDHPPACFGDALGQVLDRVSAIRRLLPESYRRNGDDADQDRGYKGLARGRGKLPVTFTQPTASSTARTPNRSSAPSTSPKPRSVHHFRLKWKP
jgi:hypothetical protein